MGDVLRYYGIDMNRLSDDQAIYGNYGMGRLTKVTDLSGSTAFQYDKLGNNVKKIRTGTGVAGTFATSSEYDAISRETKLTYPDGNSLSNIYTGAILTSIKNAPCADYDVWKHIVLTYDGAIMKFHVNGSSVAVIAASGDLATNTNPIVLAQTLQ